MKLIQNVIVKQILTETSKNKLLEKYKSEKLATTKRIEQLQFELKKLEKTKKYQPAT